MAISLTADFVAAAQREPYTVMFGDRAVTLRATTATGALGMQAELEVVENDEVVGFITPYARNEHGAATTRTFDHVAPTLFTTLDDALREIL
jgi:hypothetical protein